MDDFDAILYDQTQKCWLAFHSPVHHFYTSNPAEVALILEKIEALCNRDGLYAVGYLAYEAGIGFDPRMSNYSLSGNHVLNFFLFSGYTHLNDLPAPARSFSLGAWIPSVSRGQYDNAINAVKQFISTGYTYQVNYTFRLFNQLQGDPYSLFHSMVSSQGAGYSAYLRFPEVSVCSASPELFFDRAGDTITSKPMKGTIRRGRTLEEDGLNRSTLQASIKDQAENVMIVDMTRNDLGRVCEIGSVKVPELFSIEKYPTVWQMTTTVQGKSARSIPDLFGALFPCASITGAPKISTMRIIHELESTPRGIYTGAIGFIRPNLDCQFNVAIRTAVVDNKTHELTYAVGGGIVWDSTNEGEYDEALLKAEVITKPIPQFKLKESILWDSKNGYSLLDEHLQRLASSADLFDYPLDIHDLRARLNDAARSISGSEKHKMRVLLDKTGVLEVVDAGRVDDSPPITMLHIASQRVDAKDRTRYHKTTLADQNMPPKPLEEDVIYLNEHGELTETSIANIAVRLNGALVTPPISAGILPGTLRAKLIADGALVERRILLEDCGSDPEIYLLNSVRGVWRAKLANS